MSTFPSSPRTVSHGAQLEQLQQRLNATTRALLELERLVSSDLEELNLRVLYIFETFQFGRKSNVFDVNGQPRTEQKTLGMLYQEGGRAEILAKLERLAHAQSASSQPSGNASPQPDGDSSPHAPSDDSAPPDAENEHAGEGDFTPARSAPSSSDPVP